MTIGLTALVIQDPKQYYKQQIYCNSGTCFVQDIRFFNKLSDSHMGDLVYLRAELHGDFYNIEDWKIKHNKQESNFDNPRDIEYNLPQWYKDNRTNIEGEFKEFITKEVEKTKLTRVYGGSLELHIANDKSIALPSKINGDLTLKWPRFINEDMPNREINKNVKLPEEINGHLFLEYLDTIENLVLPKKITGALYILNLESSQSLVLPEGCRELVTWESINNKFKKETVS